MRNFLADHTRTVLMKKKLPTDDTPQGRSSALGLCLLDALGMALIFAALWVCGDYFLATPKAPLAYILAFAGFFLATLAMNWYRYRRSVQEARHFRR